VIVVGTDPSFRSCDLSILLQHSYALAFAQFSSSFMRAVEQLGTVNCFSGSSSSIDIIAAYYVTAFGGGWMTRDFEA